MSPTPVRPRDARTIAIEIDHREIACPEGVSVLRAAELSDIYIPSLCSHKDLSPFGGCRLCMVEIEGQRGYPLACSTIVQPGMKVLTESTALRDMRREILELILSEHPASCLICSEKEECQENQYTIRKTGVATGCRWCPNDGECELQTVVERLGVTEIHHPIDYHGYEAEHDDPFFDRDYNICILCGRCVRMCQEVRGTGVLAFANRGPRTRIATAFGRNHVEAGCEFCGSCVAVCPTGALADKVSKWDGKADGFERSTCPFCGLGCQIELHHRGGRLSRVRACADPEISDGQLCVRGRFCLPETTHHHDRARKPVLKRGPYFRDVSWDEAIDDVASRLGAVAPDEFLMLVSPDLTNESLYAAQKFVRMGLKSAGVDSTARFALPGGLDLWARLFSLPVEIKTIGDADAVIAVGLDSRYSFSVAGVQIRRALREGAALVTIDPRESNLARYAEHWLRPAPGGEGAVLRALAESLLDGATRGVPRVGVEKKAFERALKALSGGGDLAVVVGPAAFAADADGEIGEALLRLSVRERTTFLPLYYGANSRGALELGAYAESLPGLRPAATRGLTLADVLEGRRIPKLLYLVGESPFFERPACEFVIAQDTYRPPFEVDAFLPAASFAEAGGTLTNVEGRVQELARVENLPDGAITGFARPDWFIFGALAEKLGVPGLRFANAGEILREISAVVPGFPAGADRQPRRLAPGADPARPKSRRAAAKISGRVLVLEPGGFAHRGVDLSHPVEGLAELRLEEGFRLHPDDLAALGVPSGGSVTVRVDGLTFSGPAKADPDAHPGAIYVHRPFACGGLSHRRAFEQLYRQPSSVLPATIAAADKPAPRSAAPAGRALDREA